MPTYTPSPAYRDQGPYRTGVLLVNSGTPDSLTPKGIRAFLRRLLRDRRTIEVPRAIWCWILYFIILPLRPVKVVPKYRRVWTPKGSPLLLWSQELRAEVQDAIGDTLGEPAVVELGMLYSTPSVADGLSRLREAGAQRIIVLPLFPQYSGSTTAAAYDQVGRALRDWRFLPELRYIPDYHVEPDYIAALAASVRAHRAARPGATHLLVSFHGIPAAYCDDGDPYFRKCHQTATALAAALGLVEADYTVSFQSRVGAARWLEPYTDNVVEELGKRGVKQLDVICPGFAVDCLETVDEMGYEAAEIFHEAGGESLRYVPALNAEAAHAALLARLAIAHARQLP